MTPDPDISVGQFLSNVYFRARLNLGDNTQQHMLRVARGLDAMRGRSVKIGELDEDLIIGYLRYLLDRGIAPASANVQRGYLITIWRYAKRKKFNVNEVDSLSIETVRVPRRRPIAWSVADIQKMLDRARRITPRNAEGFDGASWTALILLLYYTGLRINALLSLRLDALRGGLLIVPPEVQKDDEELHIRIPEHLVSLLHRLKRPDIQRHGMVLSEMLVPWPWHRASASRAFNRHILKPAGLPDDYRLKFHAIRRTVGTVANAKAGKQAACDLLGHSSTRVTQRYLADPHLVDPSLTPLLAPMDLMPELKFTPRVSETFACPPSRLFDFRRGVASFAGREIRLPPSAIPVLIEIVKHGGVVSQRTLWQSILSSPYPASGKSRMQLHHRIHSLRAALRKTFKLGWRDDPVIASNKNPQTGCDYELRLPAKLWAKERGGDA